MRKLRLFSAVLSLFLLVPASIIWAQITKTINGTVRYQSGMSETKFSTPNGDVNVHLPQSMTGATITGTVSAEPAGKTEKEKSRNLKELLKYTVNLDGQKIPLSTLQLPFDWLVNLSRQPRTPLELLNVSGAKVGEVSLPPVLSVPATGVWQPDRTPLLTTPSNLLVKGDALNIFTNQQFAPGEKFVLTDSKGQQFTVKPVCLSANQAVIKVPDEAVLGEMTVIEEVWNQPTGKFDVNRAHVKMIDIKLTSPNTNLRPGQNSNVLATITGLLWEDHFAFSVDLRNLNPNIVTMEGGNLQRVFVTDQSAGIKSGSETTSDSFSFQLQRNITGIAVGNFSVSATLHEDYNTSNDPFRPQLNVLKTPEDFNTWAGALKKDLKEYAGIQKNDAAGQVIKANSKRAIDNLPTCGNYDMLEESIAMTYSLLQPLQVPKGEAISWLSSYEAGKAAAKSIDQNLAGQTEFISWDVIRGGMEYIQDKGERLQDAALKYGSRDVMYLLSDIKKQTSINPDQLEKINSRLEMLNTITDGKNRQDTPVHVKEGPYKSDYVPSGYRHMEEGPAKSEYWPKWLKHAALAGPRESWYVPESYIHVDSGWDKSNYISPLVKHATEEGPDKSHYVADDWYHLKTGRSRSNYLPKTIRHIDTGANKSRIEYDVPGVDKPIREWEFQQKEKPVTKIKYSLHNNRDADKSSLYNPWQNVKPVTITWNKEGSITKSWLEKNPKPIYDSAQQVNFPPYPPGYFSGYFIAPPDAEVIEVKPEKYTDIRYMNVHADIGRYKSEYFPPDYEHASEEGRDKSNYLHKEFKHAREAGPDKSNYLFERKHASAEGPDKSTYVRDYFKHVAEEGPDKSKYVDKGSKIHAWIEGPDKSKYLGYDMHHEEKGADKSKYSDKWIEHQGEGWEHASVEGPDKSKYLHDHKHASEEGPNKSYYEPKSLTHVAEEGRDKSRYVNKTMSKHAAAEGFYKSSYVDTSFTHVAEEGPDKSKYLDKTYWKHSSAEGQDKSKYTKVPTPPGHILNGIDKSRHRTRKE